MYLARLTEMPSLVFRVYYWIFQLFQKLEYPVSLTGLGLADPDLDPNNF